MPIIAKIYTQGKGWIPNMSTNEEPTNVCGDGLKVDDLD